METQEQTGVTSFSTKSGQNEVCIEFILNSQRDFQIHTIELLGCQYKY